MHVPSVIGGSSEAAYGDMPGAPVARLGWRVLRADLSIHGQADRVLADKQARDLRKDWRAAHVCGCQECRRAYRRTLAFYTSLGHRPPARECSSASGLSWYIRHSGASPSGHR